MSRSPSAPAKRRAVAAVALIGLLIAITLTLDQVGVLARVWEPLFGDGSERVLHSALSRALPVPDASLGALAYLVEIVTVLPGDADRWRTRPWRVLVYAAAALGLGVVSVILVALQGLVFHAFCTLCLGSALISVVLVGPAVPEARAALGAIGRRGHR